MGGHWQIDQIGSVKVMALTLSIGSARIQPHLTVFFQTSQYIPEIRINSYSHRLVVVMQLVRLS